MLPTLEALAPIQSILTHVPQNPRFHAEGNVLTHTHLVMAALNALPEYRALDKQTRELLMIAAALHDLGKEPTTRWVDGRWRSPHHGRVGAQMVREILIGQFGLCGTPETLRQRETICELIRCHMTPYHVFDTDRPDRVVRQMAAVQELTPFYSLEKLALLAKADCLGRICDDQAARLQDVELFVELALDQRCASQPFAYPDPTSRYADFSGMNIVPGQKMYKDTWGTVIMLSGLPGTGKDTWANTQHPELPMISLDALRKQLRVRPTDDQGAVAQAAQAAARELLRQKTPFIFNATNLSSMLRRKWVTLFHAYGAAVQIVYLETPWEERIRRNASRPAVVSEAVVSSMLRRLEVPQLTEAEEVRWICV